MLHTIFPFGHPTVIVEYVTHVVPRTTFAIHDVQLGSHPHALPVGGYGPLEYSFGSGIDVRCTALLTSPATIRYECWTIHVLSHNPYLFVENQLGSCSHSGGRRRRLQHDSRMPSPSNPRPPFDDDPI